MRVMSYHGAAVPDKPATTLAVASVGYLLPVGDFACVVHSVFARAVNFARAGGLLTLASPQAGDAPTTMVLRHEPAQDLRKLFEVGSVARCRDRNLCSARVVVRLDVARIWRPQPRRDRLARNQVDAHLRVAADRLALKRQTCQSVISGPAATRTVALAQACLDLDRDRAVALASSLIGWGEGLTPAGDDFLVGFLAGLDALADDAARRHFRDELGLAIAARAGRTTEVAAHFLRLAARRHYADVLDRLRGALLCAHRCALVERTLQRAFDVGATSGADMVSGLLTGLKAWLPIETSLAQQ
jgi:hypothetical protein